MNEKDRRVGRLTRKVTRVLIFLAVILTSSICIACYFEFTNVIEGMYHTEAFQVGTVVNSMIPSEFISDLVDFQSVRKYGSEAEIKEAEEKIKKSSEYQEVVSLMESFRNNMNISHIFLYDFTGNDGKVGDNYVSIIDITNPELTDIPVKSLGETGSLEGNKSIIEKVYLSGTRASDAPLTYRAETAYSVIALVPVIYRRDRVIGVIGVEDPMLSLNVARGRFLLLTIVIALVITAIIIIGFVIYYRKYFLRPLYKVIDETKKFIENPSEPGDLLEEIKTNDDIEILGESINTLENAIDGYVNHIERISKEHQRVETELDIATKIQSGMLPSKFPYFTDRDEFDIYAFMSTAKEVGGDFYDFYLIDDDHLGVVIADVSGKGIPAALFMALSKTLIKDYAMRSEDYGEIFTKVNDSLCEGNEEDLFVTALLIVYEISTGKAFFVNAGHNPPLIMDENGKYHYKELNAGLVLAALPGIPYTATEIDLKPGQKIFLYTDGVVEAQNEENELFGEDRLKEILDNCKDLSLKETLEEVKRQVDEFAGSAEQFDDITMVLLELKK